MQNEFGGGTQTLPRPGSDDRVLVRKMLQRFFLQELAHDLFYTSMLTIECVVELTHVVIGNFSCQFIQGASYFWMLPQYLLTDDGNCFIRREVLTVIVKDKKIKGPN